MWRIFVRPHAIVLGTYFHHVKVPFSRFVDLFRPKACHLPPDVDSLEDFSRWASDHMRWRMDPLWGVLDMYPSLKHMAWQLRHLGRIENDCDGLAYFTAASVKRYSDEPREAYVVTIVLSPARLPLNKAAHAMCFLRAGGKWRVLNNGLLYPRRYATFREALVENPYSRGHRITFFEVRDADLRRVATPVD